LKYTIKKKYINNKEYIFDPIRKKYIVNTPEEWVRQNFIRYLHNEKEYPISLMSTENLTIVNKQKKRTDLICYNNKGNAILLIECKSEKINLNNKTFNQVQNYNHKINADYIIITNGIKTLCFKVENQKPSIVKKIPQYTDLINI
tara:strand:- start:336 stop:770 length:435 start_codon:yes stop_codon:yes gene_type:complete